MTAIEATTEAALESAERSSSTHVLDDDASEASEPTAHTASDSEPPPAEVDVAATDESEAATSEDAHAAPAEPAEPASEAPETNLERLDRKKLEEQLEALKRKEFELRRALMMADHPALAEAIRAIEGRAYAITRVEAKLAQGPSKAEARRREAIDKKLGSLREKRADLDTQIAQLESELAALGADRTQVYEAERREALEQLLVALGTHAPAFEAVGVEPRSIVPEIERFLPEVEALAESFVAARDAQAQDA